SRVAEVRQHRRDPRRARPSRGVDQEQQLHQVLGRRIVGWMIKTSRPRTFSSILTKISPSANRRIVTAHSGCPKWWAISSASGRLAVPARSSNWLRDNDRSRIGPRKVVGKAREAKTLTGRVGCRMLEPVDDLQARLAAALAGHYTIEREIGRGGMSIVYQARDLRNDAWVALKVLRA